MIFLPIKQNILNASLCKFALDFYHKSVEESQISIYLHQTCQSKYNTCIGINLIDKPIKPSSTENSH